MNELIVRDGIVDDRDAQVEALQAEVTRLRRELAMANGEIARAKADTAKALSALRTQLAPLYRALQAVFGEIESAVRWRARRDTASPSASTPTWRADLAGVRAASRPASSKEMLLSFLRPSFTAFLLALETSAAPPRGAVARASSPHSAHGGPRRT